eukprot:2303159-Prymnesium_polylepis.1
MLPRRLHHRHPVAICHLPLPPPVMTSTPRPSKRPWWRRWPRKGSARETTSPIARRSQMSAACV